MTFANYFPAWGKLTASEKERLSAATRLQDVSRGTVIHRGREECTGLLLVKSGQLRAYILSDEGREVTLYRLFDRDMCLLAAGCMMRSLQMDIVIAAEKDTEVWIIPPDVYRPIMDENAAIANLTGELMAARLSEVTWLMEQIMWKSMDRRVAAFLLEEAAIEGSDMLQITHETIANHLGTHREVVTRMLRYLAGDGLVALKRGTVEILDRKRLMALSET